MSFYDAYSRYKNFNFETVFPQINDGEIRRAIFADASADKLIALLSPAAEKHLEEMADIAHRETLKHFGRAIQLYTPIYLSNYCENRCVYCGFNSSINIERRRLTPEEVEKEAEAIAAKGIKHVLVLTGESRRMSPVSYIKEGIKVLKKYFSSIAIEIYPLKESEYRELVAAGADGLTIYQETYDEGTYAEVHPSGPKSDYHFRLDAPERGVRSGMRFINIGALFGLSDWKKEAFFTALHAQYLEEKFPDTELSVSIPRIRPQSASFEATYNVSDKNIVQIILVLRLFMPRLGITLSTREAGVFRDNLIGLGVTRISAGSTTKVGGHAIQPGKSSATKIGGSAAGGNRVRGASQFDISDERSVAEIKAMLEQKGYQPVFKDWVAI
jgi:2-iminoacetate synthase